MLWDISLDSPFTRFSFLFTLFNIFFSSFSILGNSMVDAIYYTHCSCLLESIQSCQSISNTLLSIIGDVDAPSLSET